MQQTGKGHERKRGKVKASCPGRELTKPVWPLSVQSRAGTVQNHRVLLWKRVTVRPVPKAERRGSRQWGAARPCRLGPPIFAHTSVYLLVSAMSLRSESRSGPV